MAVEMDPALKCTIPRALYYVEKLYKLKYLSMVHFCFEALETCLPREIKSMFFVTSFFYFMSELFFSAFCLHQNYHLCNDRMFKQSKHLQLESGAKDGWEAFRIGWKRFSQGLSNYDKLHTSRQKLL